MVIRKKVYLIILLSVLFVSNLFAQTPAARTWFYNDNGVKTEVKERWDEDADGFKHGKYILYGYDCGWSRKYYVDEVGYYSHGKKDGVWKYFSCAGDGEIYIIGTYKNDVKIGIWKEIYDSKEKIYQEGTYLNGKRNGVWINTDNTQTKKGYKVIYNNDEVISVYDDKGINLLEVQKQNDEKEVLDKKVESDFYKCKTSKDFKQFRIIYPNSKFDNEAQEEIMKLNAEDAFYSTPNIQTLINYEKFNGGTYGQSLLRLNKTLNDTVDLASGIIVKFEFRSDYYGRNGYKDRVYKLYDSILKPYQLNIIYNYLIESNESEATFFYSKGRVEIVCGKITTRFFIGDNFSTSKKIISEHDETYRTSVFKDGIKLCECFYPISNKDIETENSYLCALRAGQTLGITSNKEEFLKFIKYFSLLKNTDEREFIINRQKGMLTENSPQFSWMQLAYLYWINGDEYSSLQVFKKIKDSQIPIKNYFDATQYEELSLNDFIKFHKAYLSSSLQGEFPNESEMLKKIKNL